MCLQRRRHFLARNIDVCPRKLFIFYSTQFIAESISLELEVVLTVDANEHVVRGKFARQLRILGIKEAYCTKFNPEGGPASHLRGKHQIDELWTVSICPFNF